MKIIDAHSHIDYITYNHQKDVVGTICATTTENQWIKLINLMCQDKNIYGAFGVHPWFVDSVSSNFIQQLECLLNANSNYMVGEIGLDKYKPNMDKQIECFIKQFDLAVKLNRPVFLHCVGAWDKILHVLKQYKTNQLPIIVAHSFNAGHDILKQLLRYENIMFSFCNLCMSHKNCCIEQIPIERIVVESDGKENSDLVKCINDIIKSKHNDNADIIIYNNTQRIIKNEQIA